MEEKTLKVVMMEVLHDCTEKTGEWNERRTLKSEPRFRESVLNLFYLN